MNKLKSLAADTIVYGLSTILGRLLNWLLTPFYIRTILQSDFGVVINLYSIIAVLLVVATLGFETGYFRFVNESNRRKLFDSIILGIIGFGFFWFLLFFLFEKSISLWIEVDRIAGPVLIMAAAIVWVDAINSIPFAQLRYDRRSKKYAVLRLIQVAITIVLNILFLVTFKDKSFGIFSFKGEYAVFNILLANLLGSFSLTLYFGLQIIKKNYIFDFQLFKQIFKYSLPLVGMGLFGMLNQNIEKFMIVKLIGNDDAYRSLAIYGANYKIGILMAIFTQSFRMAFEPFFFKENRESENVGLYGKALNYFVLFGLLIYSGILCFLPIINLLLTSEYIEGNVILPYILGGQLFFGIYYSFSIWYKVTDLTYFGVVMSFFGLVVNVFLNFILIPILGYMGAAIGTFFGYLVMMILSYFLGNKYYPIPYPVKRLLLLSVVVVVWIGLYQYLFRYFGTLWFVYAILFFGSICVLLFWKERILLFNVLVYGKRKS